MGCCYTRSEPINKVNFEEKPSSPPKSKRSPKKYVRAKSSIPSITENETKSPEFPSKAFNRSETFASRECIKSANQKLKHDYKFIKHLNNGSGSKVKLVIDKRLGLRRVIKKIRTASINKGVSEETIIQEFEKFTELVLNMQDHPNIVKIYELVNYEDGYYLVTEPLMGGTLSDKIEKRYHSEELIKSCTYNILTALNYCHKRGIVHRNITPESILFDSFPNNPVLKLTSFGLPWISPEKLIKMEHLLYMAPELIAGTRDKIASDIWSTGVILFIMLTDRPPFIANKKKELLESINNDGFHINDDYFLIYSNDVKDLLKKMLIADFSQRILAEEALNHPWFQSLHKLNPDSMPAQKNLFRLLQFQNRSKIERSLFGYTVAHISYSTEEKLCIELFKFLDSDYDGIINKQDLLNKIELFENPIAAEAILKNCKDEAISYSEFVAATIDWNSPEQIKKLQSAFDFIDFNKNGSLCINEIKNSFPRINDREINQFMKKVDTDKDGKISFEDLKTYLIKKS